MIVRLLAKVPERLIDSIAWGGFAFCAGFGVGRSLTFLPAWLAC